MELIREIRDLQSDRIIIKVPEEFRRKRVEILVFPLEESNKEALKVREPENEGIEASGLCGLWQDERSADEIIEDIYSHRTGFGSRRVKL